jgi:hypothetical protein
MEKEDQELSVVIFLIVFVAFLGFGMGKSKGMSLEKERFQKEAISLNFAHYNPINAAFEWKKPNLEK